MRTKAWMVVVAVMLACNSGNEDGLVTPSPSAGQGGGGIGGAGESQGGAGQAGAGMASAGSGIDIAACWLGDTRECLGPGACKGGQVCRQDLKGWEPCDCGGAGAAGQAGAGAGGAAGSPAGAGGAGGSSCIPLPKEKACAANQCGVASDGCGGEVPCNDCGGWQGCEIQQGTKVCVDICQKKPITDGSTPCAESAKFKGEYPTSVECNPTTIALVTQGDDPGCKMYFTYSDGTDVSVYVACCKE